MTTCDLWWPQLVPFESKWPSNGRKILENWFSEKKNKKKFFGKKTKIFKAPSNFLQSSAEQTKEIFKCENVWIFRIYRFARRSVLFRGVFIPFFRKNGILTNIYGLFKNSFRWNRRVFLCLTYIKHQKCDSQAISKVWNSHQIQPINNL